LLSSCRISPTAFQHLNDIFDYIARENISAAAATITGFLDAVGQIEQFPRSGREGRRAGTREFVVEPYVIVYRILEDVIAIDAVLHGRRSKVY
jgi:addiction module RelE/StbE family toxin